MDYKKIGELICQLRKEKGLTQLQLAEKLHVSDKAVSKWERGIAARTFLSSTPLQANSTSMSTNFYQVRSK